MKWRRDEDQLTPKQRQTLVMLISEGYSKEACMERFGLTHVTQVKHIYEENRTGEPLASDKVSVSASHRTTMKEVMRSMVGDRRFVEAHRKATTRNRADSFGDRHESVVPVTQLMRW